MRTRMRKLNFHSRSKSVHLIDLIFLGQDLSVYLGIKLWASIFHDPNKTKKGTRFGFPFICYN
jgi:hypothetical protein